MKDHRSEDADLVAGVVTGDQKALKAIYRKYGGAVHYVAREVLRDDGLAQDVVQEVFVSFWRAPEGFDADRGSLRNYLLILRTDAQSTASGRKRRARRREESSAPESAVVDIDDDVWARSQSALVREAVAQLGDEEREAISPAYFGGMSHVEVAEALAEPVGTVKSRIRSGMRKPRHHVVRGCAMSSRDMHELVSLYALDALVGEEHDRFVEHLDTCPECQSKLTRHREAAASLVPDRPASDETWARIAGVLAGDGRTGDEGVPLRRAGSRSWKWATGIAAAVALVFASLVIFDAAIDEGLTAEGIVAAAESLADQAGTVVGEFVVGEETVARVVLADDGRGFVIPHESLESLEDNRTDQLCVIKDNEDVISAGVLGSEPVPATFTWTGDVSGFALTREVVGGVVSSGGEVVSVITDV